MSNKSNKDKSADKLIGDVAGGPISFKLVGAAQFSETAILAPTRERVYIAIANILTVSNILSDVLIELKIVYGNDQTTKNEYIYCDILKTYFDSPSTKLIDDVLFPEEQYILDKVSSLDKDSVTPVLFRNLADLVNRINIDS
ncbi:hypothetical protein [Flexibacterium corallicola]|uniref:hypothetical protein n=1 Tax=Flexibacterium corallicola TaxID=3037259 RepID=UPI00286ED6FF|nr:hypothetical protein [Pseudovibrio sp. M1P-2-3]